MKHCPAATCPFLEKNGYASEYGDQATTCADCGSELIAGPAPARPQSTAEPLPRALWGRLAWTVLVPLAAWALGFVPLPGLGELWTLFDQVGGQLSAVSIVALGLQPFITAAVLVEVVAAAVPRWRRLRLNGAPGRRRLVKASLMLAVLLALVQAWGVRTYLESVAWEMGYEVPAPFWVIGPALTAGTLLLVALARLTAARGLTHGIPLFIVAASLVAEGRVLFEIVQSGMLETPQLVGVLLALGAMVALSWWILTHRRVARPRPDKPAVAVRHPTSGQEPIGWLAMTLSLVLILGSGAGFWIWDAFQQAISLTSLAAVASLAGPIAVIVGALVAFSVAWTLVFNGPRRLRRLMARAWELPEDAEAVRGAARGLILRGMAWSAALWVGLYVASRLTDFVPEALVVVSATAVALDVLAELRARRDHGPLVAVRPMSRVYAVDTALSALELDGVPAHARGVHFRALLQFLGPFVPVVIMVPPDHAEAASARLSALLDPAPAASDAKTPPAAEAVTSG